MRVEAANDAQTAWVNTAYDKEHSQKNLSQLILLCRNVCNHVAEETNNPVYKLTTSELQLVSINVLI